MRIAHKLFLNFLCVILFVGAGVYLAIHTGQAELEKRIREEASFLVGQIMDDIDRHIQQRVEEFQIYSKDTVLQEALARSDGEMGSLEDVEGHLKRQDDQWHDRTSSARASWIEGVLNNHLSEELREKILFSEKKHGYRIYSGVSVTNKYGVNIAATRQPLLYREDKNIWWEKAKANGLYVDDLKPEEDGSGHSMDIAVRVDDRNGDFVGVLRSALGIEGTAHFLKDIHQQMIRRGRYKGVDFALLTRDLRVIFSTTGDRSFGHSPQQWRPRLWERDGIDHWVGTADAGAKEYKLFAHAHSRGYKDLGGTGWVLVFSQDLRAAFSPVYTLRHYWGGIFALMIIFAVLLSWHISHTVSRPVIELQEAATQVSHGKLDVHVHLDHKDELGTLSQAFNKMVHALKQGQHQMQQSVKLSTLSRLSANIADQINNPLGFVVGNLEALKKYLWSYREFMSCARELKDAVARGDKDQAAMSAQKMSQMEKDHNWDFIFDDMENLMYETREGIERIEKLSKELRSFVRQDTGKLEMYSVEEIVEIALGAVRGDVRPGVEIKREYSLVPSLKCNPQRLGQAFMNILTSRALVVEKGGAIGVKIYAREGDIVVEIWDTGRWIPKEKLAEIFDPLVGMELRARGVGLGLSMSLDIVQQHGGTIEVTSAEGQRTSFMVRLPLRRSQREGTASGVIKG